MLSLAYGRNVLRQPLAAEELVSEAERLAAEHPDLTVQDLLSHLTGFLSAEGAGDQRRVVEIEPWRIRTVKAWIRTNPPPGAVYDKDRPGTSYIIVATVSRDRYFDLDGVRMAALDTGPRKSNGRKNSTAAEIAVLSHYATRATNDLGGPPLDWSHHVDEVIDAELDRRGSGAGGGLAGLRGVHIRRALERAGVLSTREALDVAAKGYPGAHFAVWPERLVRLLVAEMCPRRVCTVCGQPSRRLVQAEPSPFTGKAGIAARRRNGRSKGPLGVGPIGVTHGDERRRATTLGWSHCGCGEGCQPTTWRKVRTPVIDENTGKPVLTPSGRPKMSTTRVVDDPGACADPTHWRPGTVLDPFVGSGTTLSVCSGADRDSVGIDLNAANVDLVRDRVGMFLDVDLPADGGDRMTGQESASGQLCAGSDRASEHVLALEGTACDG